MNSTLINTSIGKDYIPEAQPERFGLNNGPSENANESVDSSPTVLAQDTRPSNSIFSLINSITKSSKNESALNFSNELETIRSRNQPLETDKTTTNVEQLPVSAPLPNLVQAAAAFIEGSNKPSDALNKIIDMISKLFGDASIKAQTPPLVASQDPEQLNGRPVMANNIGHELPPMTNAYSPENRSLGNQSNMQATPSVHSGSSGLFQPTDAVSGVHTAYQGSADFKQLYTEMESRSGYSLRNSINRLLTEVSSQNFKNDLQKSAAWALGIQRISKDIMDRPLSKLIASDNRLDNELGLKMLNASFASSKSNNGLKNLSVKDPAGFELMHLVNPRKNHPNVKSFYGEDNSISREKGRQLKQLLKNGESLTDIFGKAGGMSSSGLLGKSMSKEGIAQISAWAGSSNEQLALKISRENVSVELDDFDGNNEPYFAQGKRGHGGSDTNIPGRAKFQRTWEIKHLVPNLNFLKDVGI
ncbi:MAG: hypothetical protein KTR16_12260 [Acidiferrobacterales bacterium]|nr:hypothetical protein [Acidiferrobacterales bacterium]